MSGQLAAVYNEAVRGVPHCYPVSEEGFAAELAAAAGQGEGHKGLHSEAAFAAREGGALAGFVHTGIKRATEKKPQEQGMIRFLWYRRGRRAVGQALLAAAEKHLREHGMTQASAFHQDYRYRCYHFTHAYLSDHLDHVQALLAFNGYKQVAGEVFLDWPDYELVSPASPEPAVEVRVEQEPGRGRRPGLRLSAHSGGKQVGVCVSACAGEWHDADDAQDWIFTEWLSIEEEVQGKGLGRHLLQRALQEARALGYRHAAISTARDNARALLFYSNYGYQVVDWTYEFARDLKSG